jgi:hypothetical protein
VTLAAAFVVGSGKEQLMVLSDTTNMPALFAKHPNWHGAIDADPVLAETTISARLRRKTCHAPVNSTAPPTSSPLAIAAWRISVIAMLFL